MFSLQPPRHIPTLPLAPFGLGVDQYRSSPISKHFRSPSACLKGATKGLTHLMFHPSYAPFADRSKEGWRFGRGLTR